MNLTESYILFIALSCLLIINIVFMVIIGHYKVNCKTKEEQNIEICNKIVKQFKIKQEELISKYSSRGEATVTCLFQEAKTRAIYSDFHIFNYIYAKENKYDLIQIDHLVVCPYGVFIIETKDWRGKTFVINYTNQRMSESTLRLLNSFNINTSVKEYVSTCTLNVKKNSDGKFTVSDYGDPVVQIRKQAKALKPIIEKSLGENQKVYLKNVVLYLKRNDGKNIDSITYIDTSCDTKNGSYYNVDKYTSIMELLVPGGTCDFEAINIIYKYITENSIQRLSIQQVNMICNYIKQTKSFYYWHEV